MVSGKHHTVHIEIFSVFINVCKKENCLLTIASIMYEKLTIIKVKLQKITTLLENPHSFIV